MVIINQIYLILAMAGNCPAYFILLHRLKLYLLILHCLDWELNNIKIIIIVIAVTGSWHLTPKVLKAEPLNCKPTTVIHYPSPLYFLVVRHCGIRWAITLVNFNILELSYWYVCNVVHIVIFEILFERRCTAICNRPILILTRQLQFAPCENSTTATLSQCQLKRQEDRSWIGHVSFSDWLEHIIGLSVPTNHCVSTSCSAVSLTRHVSVSKQFNNFFIFMVISAFPKEL